VLVLDTESKLPGLNLNLDRMRSFLRLVDPKRVDVAVIDGDQATTGNILATIQGLGDCSNDTVLFYYSGHCATDLGRGHTLTFSHGPDRYLLRATLTREIARLRPRLAVVLTDGCSNLGVLPPPDAPTKAAPAPSATPPAEETLPQRIARSLLLRTRGFVDINGSTFDAALGLNEAGIYGDEGGFFTSALFFGVAGPFVNTYEDIDRNHDGVVAWAEVLPSIRKALRIKYGTTRHVALSTPDKLSERIRKTLNGQLTQTPHAFSLDGPALEPRVEEAFFLGASLTDATAVDPETKRPIAGARLGDVVDPIDQLGSVMTILGGAVAEGDLVIAVNNKPIRSIRDLKSAGASSSAVNDVRIWSPKRQAFETVHLTPEQTGSSLPPVTPQPGPAPPPGGGESHAPRPARPY
jgi:hypothetical protein